MIFFKEKYSNIDFYFNFKLRKDMWDFERFKTPMPKTFHNTPNLVIALNCLNEHWIVVTNIDVIGMGNDNQSKIFVFDSFNSNYYIKALKPLLKYMYPAEQLMQINRVKMNYEQQEMNDCGLFCLGYIEYISRGINPFSIKFNQSLMRAEYINFSRTKKFNSENFVTENKSLEKLNVKTFILALNNNLNEILTALEPLKPFMPLD